MNNKELIDKTLNIVDKNPFLRNEIEVSILESVNKGMKEDKVFGDKFIGFLKNNLKERKEFWKILIGELNNERDNANKTSKKKSYIYE